MIEAEKILIQLGEIADREGFEIYAVGGYVRDKFLGKVVKDIDIVVVGDGIQFAKTVAFEFKRKRLVVFERFETAMLPYPGYDIEFVSARKEYYEEKSRKPIVKKATLKDDLSRRDFTINAMAMGLNHWQWTKIIDPFNGREDLQKRIIRTPLTPSIAFNDDPLRMMRAIRFASQLNFQIDPDVIKAIGEMNTRLTIVSKERITDELLKILKTPIPSIGLKLLLDTGILNIVFSELSDLVGVEQRQDYHHKDVFDHTLQVVDNIAQLTDDPLARFIALVHDIGKPRTKNFIEGKGWTFYEHEKIGADLLKDICYRLKLPTSWMKRSQKIVQLHMRPMALADDKVSDSAIRRLIVLAGEELEMLIMLARADISSKKTEKQSQHLESFERLAKRIYEVKTKDRLHQFQSPVTGKEIMAVYGIKEGPLIGSIKRRIEDAILEGEIPNDYDAAKKFMIKIKKEFIYD